jgi:hypothetical protein
MVANSKGEKGRDGWSVHFIWFSYNNTNTAEHICMHVDTPELQH